MTKSYRPCSAGERTNTYHETQPARAHACMLIPTRTYEDAWAQWYQRACSRRSRHGIFLPGLRWQRLQKNRCAATRSLSLQWTKAALGRLELKKASRWMLSTMPSTAAVPLPTTARGTTGRKGQARAEAGTPLVDRCDTATDTSGMTPALDAPTPFDCPFMGRGVWRSGRSVCVQRSQPRSKAHLHSTRDTPSTRIQTYSGSVVGQ